MTTTPEWLNQKICAYYRETVEASYLKTWSGASLAFHMGLDHDPERPLEESLDRTNDYLAERAGIRSGDLVLDAGCGVGGSALFLARSRGARVVGISIDSHQVELAQRFAIERSCGDRVQYQCADYMELPFADATLDVVWHIESLCYAFNLDDYLMSARRVLRSGGRFACIDVFRGDRGDPEHHRALSEGCVLHDLHSREEVIAALGRAGFVAVDTEDLTPRILGSAAVLGHLAALRRIALGFERALLDRQAPIYEAHVRGGLGAVKGFMSGAVTYGYVGAVCP